MVTEPRARLPFVSVSVRTQLDPAGTVLPQFPCAFARPPVNVMLLICRSAEPTLCSGRNGSRYPRLICGFTSGEIFAKKAAYVDPQVFPRPANVE